MAPTPLQHLPVEAAPGLDGESIVISGISGLYPKSRNIQEFSEILYNKVNPVTKEDVRFNVNHPEVVMNTGIIPELSRFGAQYFKVHNHLADAMDAIARKILEQSYQAMYDAGVNPNTFSGKKVGVYTSSCFSESEKVSFYKTNMESGLGLLGCNRTMFANRVSYCLNAKGPSMTIDAACCGSTAALEQAYNAIRRGDCEAAIVSGARLCLHPQLYVQHRRTISLSKDGTTKSFDQHAEGCGQSECINVLLLQKAKDALRIYAEVVHTKTEFVGIVDGKAGPQYGFSRTLSKATKFFNQFYEEANIQPNAVEYVEAFGCAEPEADRMELEAIENVFCKDKRKPLLVGSVISNIGYTEAASGIAAITKVLLGYHTGKLAANLNCSQPRQDVDAVRDGRIRIVTEHQPFQHTYAAVNNMSYSGLNSHVLLRGHYKSKNSNRYNTNIPYLITVSGRQESSVHYILQELKTHPIDPEQVALLHNLHKTNFSAHLGRGFTILQTDKSQETISLCEETVYFDDKQPPLWFVYSGMGSQWAKMGEQLMRIPIFAAAIDKCRCVLEPKGINIIEIITSPEEKFESIAHSFVGIAAMQIGLTDILHAIGLIPDGIIGHSVGELGCAYADGCLSAEEMILAAFSRGMVSLNTPFIRGSMAAVGLGYSQISGLCPPEIDVVCHNGPESCTISGPADIMRQFVAELAAKGIFAKEVACSNIAYHSRYIAAAGPSLLDCMKDIIKSPKPRSARWLSTSVPQENWSDPIAQLCSAEYFTNNLLNPVLFEETSKLVPSNAVLVEVAPHGLLQAILTRSLPNCKHIPLTRRGHTDNVLFLLQNIGNLYLEGFNLDVEKMYPKVDFPVSTGTPFLSHFIKWAHEEKRALTIYTTANRLSSASCNFVVSFHDLENIYLKGHSIRGKTLFPYAASLMLVWDTLSMVIGVTKKKESVEFTDLHLYAQPVLHNQYQLNLCVSLHKATGKFEVLNDNAKVMRGFIKILEPKEKLSEVSANHDGFSISSEDIYNILLMRDYNYSEEFRSIKSASASFDSCELVWRDNWVTLIDGMLQLNMLRQPHAAVSLPTYIRKLELDVNLHNDTLSTFSSENIMAVISEIDDSTRCGGILMKNIRFEYLPPQNYNYKMILRTSKSKTPAEDNGEVEDLLQNNIFGLPKGNFKLECSHIGDYDSLTWVDTPEVGANGIPVTVHYAGINSNDIKKVNGTNFKKTIDNKYGIDFSGITDRGERVMGIVASGAASSRVAAVPELLWPVPSHWSLEDAATVPFAYGLAFYCLSIKCKLVPTMSVYVHGVSGAFGQAVISIALAAGCRVFGSVSDSKKKALLRRLFPELREENIGCSRDINFQDFVINATKGSGCDVVISTSRGTNMKNNAIRCCAYMGIVMDLTQIQDQEAFSYGMFNLTGSRNYLTIDWFALFNKDKHNMQKIQQLMCEGIARGYVRPLPRVTYAASDVPRAFRFTAAGKPFGRVLLRLMDSKMPVQAKFVCNSTSCHLVLCDGENFALQFIDRLIEHGAKKLCIYFNKSANLSQYKMRLWKNKGVQVAVFSEKLNEGKDVVNLLNQAMSLGAVEGIYFVTKGDQKYHEDLLNKMDVASTQTCHKLRYFAVLNTGTVNEIMEKTIRQRIENQLPAVSLQLPELQNQYMLSSAALNAAERALCCAQSVLYARVAQQPPLRLLQQLSSLAGIYLSEEMNKNITLEELGLRYDRVPLVCSFLKTEYNIVLEENQISSLTIELLLNLENSVTELPYKDVKGLSTFFEYFNSDELLATTDIVCLPTLTSNPSVKDSEFTVNEIYLCIVPGMEGHYERFHKLCSRLKLAALGLQPGLDRPHETPRDTAERYVQVLLKKTDLKDKFYLMGYETGVIVALEMAAILESRGMTGTVFCIGHAPDELKTVFAKFLIDYDTETKLQDAVIRHMYTLMTGDNNMVQLEISLESATTWSEKVDCCVRILLGRVSHSAQYARGFIEAGLARMKQLRDYSGTTQKLRSKLVLLRARCDEMAQLHSLQQYSLQPIVEYQLDAPLAHSALDLRCAAIINSHLDPVILEEFQNKNICQTYLLDDGEITTSLVD